MKYEKVSDEVTIAATQNIEDEKFWLEQLAGELACSKFPTDYNKRPRQARKIDVFNFVFPGELFSKLMTLSGSHDIRLFIIMTAGLVILLDKYTHNKDIILGTSIYQQDMDVEFINTVLALRNRVTPNITFKEFLMQVGQVIFEAYKHQNYPVEILPHLLNMPLVPGEDFPLFDTVLVVENLHNKQYLQHIHVNMVLVFKRTSQGLEVNVEYNSLLYRLPTIQRIASHLMNLLKTAVFNVNLPVSGIDLLSKTEKEEILFGFNETQSGYSRDKTTHQLFQEQVERTPHHTAVIGEEGVGTRFIASDSPKGYMHITYKELNRKSNQLAWELRKRGLKPNSFAAVIIHRSIQMVTGVTAILKAGGAYVPLETYLPEARLITCLSSLNVEFLLIDSRQLDKIHQISGRLPGMQYVFCLDEPRESKEDVNGLFKNQSFILPGQIRENAEENPTPAASAADIAYVIFTSGTTGTPKGVIETHRPVINIIQWVNNTFNVKAGDKLLFVASLGFDLSVYDIFGILAAGGSVRVVKREEMKLPDHLLEVIYREGITFWDSAPAALQQLVPYITELTENSNNRDKTSALRLVFLSGDWIPVTIPDILKAAFPGVKVTALGGATEATIWSNYYPIDRVDPDWVSIPYGKPLQNAKYYILDQMLTPCPIGVPGGLYIGGECLASGYINDEELTAKKFIPNPFVPGETIYRTGDLARWFPDGNMEFLGRQDKQVKIRGYRIELGEIESQLLEHHQIKAAVVIARGEEKGDRYLCAYYLAENDFSSTELSNYLSQILPEYMIPSYFIKINQVPLTPNGKLDRKSLPVPIFDVDTEKYTAPGNEIETKIVKIWSDILHLEEEKIGIDSDFFVLGGHSLNATTMVSRLHKELDIKLKLVEVFSKPTIRALSAIIKGAEIDKYISIAPVEDKEYYPLSSAQKRMFILHRMDQANTAYNMRVVLPLPEDFDRERFESTFKKLIARHENLRTSFELLADEPVQRIHKEVDFSIRYHEVDEIDLVNIISSFSQPFDLSQPPLIRGGLVRAGRSQQVLILDMHHIITDENSQNVLTGEFMALYAQKELPPLRLQYRDYSQWQNSESQQKTIKKQEDYWLKEFAGELARLNLPMDYARPPIQGFEGRTVSFWLSKEQGRRLNRIAHEQGSTVFMLVLTIYYILLSKLSSQEEIIVGTPIAGRKHADLEPIIGMFINTLSIRNYPRGHKTFKQFLNEVKNKTLDAFENQEYPFEELVEKVKAERHPGRNPIFDVMLNLLSQEEYTGNISDDPAQDSSIHQPADARFDMAFLAVEFGETLHFDVIYSRKLFKPQTIDRIVGYFKKLVSEVEENLGRKLSDIEIISEEEKNRLLVEFNASHMDYPKDKTIVQLFEEQVAKSPGTIALTFEHSQLSYGKLNRQTNRLGSGMRMKGVQADTLVGLMVNRSLEMVVGILGILKAGSAYMPVSPEIPRNRLIYLFDNASVKLVLTQTPYRQNLQDRYQVINLDSASCYKGPGENLENRNTPGDLAYVIYTSGSTGRPKGVMIQNRSVINIVRWFAGQYHLQPGFHLVQMFEYTFDASINQVFGSLLHGVTLHIIRKEYFFDIDYLRDYMLSRCIHLINFVQSVIKELLCTGEKFPNLRYVISGAEKLKSSIKNEILSLGYNLYNQYGPTEVTVDALAEKCSYDSDGTVGTPVYNTRCYIVNQYHQLNPVGVAGELWVSGDGLARGYVNNVELTLTKFIPDPFVPGNRVYKTGDLTRWLPGGNVEFLGRIDNQVKIRGFRIEPVEIANQLVKIAGIKEAAVIDRENESGETYLCAYIVEEKDIDAAEIKKLLSMNLPDYMIPSYFISIDRIPLSGHGKLVRSALPEPEMISTGTYEAPRTGLEKKLVQIWSEVLNIEPDIIGMKSDFFELGGHSLKATILVSRLHKELNVKLPLAELFVGPTIKELAKTLEELTADQFAAVEPIEKKEYYELSPGQERLYILLQIGPGITAYNMPYVLTLGVEIDKQILEDTFKKLISRHESLRTSFTMVEEVPVQRVHDTVEFKMESIVVRNPQGKGGENILQDLVKPFDLSQAPLLRSSLVELGDSNQILFMDMHHIITDGTSQHVLKEEFLALYTDAGKELPSLKLQYKDYSQWQKSEAAKKNLEKQAAYWLKELEGDIPVLNMPTDYPRPEIQGFEGNAVDFDLSAEKTRLLNDAARSNRATLFMVLLTIYYIFLYKLSNQEDIVVGTPVAGRRHADLMQVIGMFVNTLALRNYLSGEKTFTGFLKEIKECTLAAFENQDHQFEDLVEKVVEKRDISRNPLFDVDFVLQNIAEIPVGVIEKTRKGMNAQQTYNYENRTTKFDLSLAAVEIGEKLNFGFGYSTKLFKNDTILKFIKYFKKIITAVVENPGMRLADIEIMTKEERKRILDDFNDTKVEYPNNKSIHGLFEKQVEKTPGNIALVGVGPRSGRKKTKGEEAVSLSLGKLDEKANQLAGVLKEKGVTADIPVGLMVDRSIEMITAILAILKAGGAYLPIDPRLPKERIKFMCEDSHARILLTQTDHLAKSKEITANTDLIDVSDKKYYKRSKRKLKNISPSNHLAYIIYTSGSTGKPKGVLVEHKNVMRLVKKPNYIDWTPGSKLLLTGTIVFDITTFEIWGPLLNGLCLYLVEQNDILDAQKLEKIIGKYDISILHLIPQLFNQLAEQNPGIFKGLRFLLVGGDIVRPHYINKIRKNNNHLQILHMYGPTENTTFSTFLSVDQDYETTIPIGKPIENSSVYIIDKYGKLKPPGTVGELVVGGDGVARGYLNNPELTAQKFQIPDKSWYYKSYRSYKSYIIYKTGDLAKWLPDGNVEFLGREDHQVKLRGFRIELGEIERQLLDHEKIKEAIVIHRHKNARDNKEEIYLCAYIVTRGTVDNTTAISEELREYLAARLPDYMIPSSFVAMEQIPLTPNGKIDRKALPEPEIKTGERYIAPQNEFQKKLAEIWSDILGIKKHTISIDYNFFRLGGHSLKATILAAKIYKEFNTKVPLTEIFKTPTIRELAALIKVIHWTENQKIAVNDNQDREEIVL